MSKTPQQEYQESLDILSFFGSVKSSINEIGSKVIDGRLKPDELDIKRLALEHDKAKGVTPQPVNASLPPSSPPPPSPPPSNITHTHNIIIDNQQPIYPNDDQMLLPFDKKYDLNDIFSKIDDVYRKVISLENEVFKLREGLENKKKDL